MEAAGFEAGGGIVDVGAVLAPVVGVGLVVGVGFMFLLGFDDEEAVFTRGVFGLVPLLFVVADEAVFECPVFWVGRAVVVEFVGPDEVVGSGWVFR